MVDEVYKVDEVDIHPPEQSRFFLSSYAKYQPYKPHQPHQPHQPYKPHQP